MDQVVGEQSGAGTVLYEYFGFTLSFIFPCSIIVCNTSALLAVNPK